MSHSRLNVYEKYDIKLPQKHYSRVQFSTNTSLHIKPKKTPNRIDRAITDTLKSVSRAVTDSVQMKQQLMDVDTQPIDIVHEFSGKPKNQIH
jgi:hypothetical protein